MCSDPACQVATENCSNGTDDDGDGDADCADLIVLSIQLSIYRGRELWRWTDDDGDGDVDCDDSDCFNDPNCSGPGGFETDCGDNVDNDGDGDVDCDDSDCSGAPLCSGPPVESDCSDQADNDNDGSQTVLI